MITGAIEKQTRPDNIKFDYESCDNFRVCKVKSRKTIERQFSLEVVFEITQANYYSYILMFYALDWGISSCCWTYFTYYSIRNNQYLLLMLQKIISKTAVIYFVVLLLIKVLNLYRVLQNKKKDWSIPTSTYKRSANKTLPEQFVHVWINDKDVMIYHWS